MSHMLRIHLLLPLFAVLFAVSGVLLHAAPIQKLPDDEPEESSPVVKKLPDEPEESVSAAEKDAENAGRPAGKTEAEAIREMTERLDKVIVPYKPLQRSREPLLNHDLSDEVIPTWRLIYVKNFDKPQGAGVQEAADGGDEDLAVKGTVLTTICSFAIIPIVLALMSVL